MTTFHWLTVDEAMLLGGWSNRQSVLSAIRRGKLAAENINPNSDPRRFEYRTTAEWVLDYLVHHKRVDNMEEVMLLIETLELLIAGKIAWQETMEAKRGTESGRPGNTGFGKSQQYRPGVGAGPVQ